MFKILGEKIQSFKLQKSHRIRITSKATFKVGMARKVDFFFLFAQLDAKFLAAHCYPNYENDRCDFKKILTTPLWSAQNILRNVKKYNIPSSFYCMLLYVLKKMHFFHLSSYFQVRSKCKSQLGIIEEPLNEPFRKKTLKTGER